MHFLSFFVADREFAVQFKKVSRVVQSAKIERTPEESKVFLGVLDIEGENYWVVDAHYLLKQPLSEITSKGHFFLFDTKEKKVALLVSSIGNIFDSNEVEDSVEKENAYFPKVVKREGDQLFVIDENFISQLLKEERGG